MTTFTRLLTAVAALFLSLSVAQAQDTKHPIKIGDLVIHKPWSRATPKTAKVGAGYLKIENTGTTSDRLTKIETSIAGHAEIHEMKMNDGVMKMRRLDGGVEIPAGESVSLKPGANHIMFMKLNGPIQKDQPFKATLTFETAGTIEVTFTTVKIGGKPKKTKRGSH